MLEYNQNLSKKKYQSSSIEFETDTFLKKY